ncbi:MAG TPA: class E sortase, partial [Acidimicrobiales bacterium]
GRRRKPPRRGLARVLGGAGRTCIAAGVLTLLFVVYQLWGTGIREAQAQSSLQNEFDRTLADAGVEEEEASAPAPDTSTPVSTAPVPPPPPPEGGDAVAHLLIPRIGVDKIVVQGVTLDDLKRGPGHYPDTPLPGQPGNAAIAGHRTTYGAPFNRIDELQPGDEILITTVQGSFEYAVTGQQIVSPTQVEVLEQMGDNRLTLTACHPKYSARQRIVVTARLVGPAAAAPPPTTAATGPATSIPGDAQGATEPPAGDEAATLDGAGLSGHGAPAWPAIMLAVACGAIWLAAWLLGKLWLKWPAYALGLPLFAVTLFYFFESFSRLLPANF